ncbi:hypothetical protein [Pseudonocardia sp. WMMC193]|uniref:hypothetical protein n=1 Tax=Pseudonocardia sp. WMMC193 TaxID=2911965 RepID=UPI001F29E5CE|nr:hypothetical protein [Pseudonocardia sp. WMMC193]MCF7549840.1 hypothetical protein [Pseudonocardia sp. WMMC193]
MRARTLEEANMSGDVRSRVVVLGVGSGDPEAACLEQADHVLVAPELESAVLFYAEAWRVDRVRPGDAVTTVADLLALDGPCTVALVVPDEPAWRAVVDGLRVAADAEVTVPGTAVVPPRLSPLW